MPDNDSKFLKFKARVLAVNAGNTEDVLTSPITVKDYRGYRVGDTIPVGTKLIDIITKEFLSTAPTHTITITTVGQGTTDPSGTQSVTDGQNFTLNSATPNTGWKLKDVKLDGTVVTLPNTVSNVTRDHTYVATFEELPPTPTYTVTPSAGANGSISPSTAQTFNENDPVNITFTATPNTGYEVNNWKLNGIDVQTGGSTFTLSIPSITADQRVEVSFKDVPVVVEQYHVVVTDNTASTLSGAGTISPAAGSHDINVGTDTVVTVTPNTGFKVKTFTVDGTDVTSPYTITGAAKDQTVAVIVEFEEVVELAYDAYVQTSRSAGWSKPTVDNLVLGTGFNLTKPYTQTVPAPGANRYVIPALIYPKSAGNPTSIKEGDITESITAFTVGDTITIDGIEYYITYSNSVNTQATTSPTTFVYRW